MPRLAYVNGRYVPHARAMVHVEDRGYQFGDAVYEALDAINGVCVDLEAHFDRLDRSLSELQMAWPVSRRALGSIITRLLACNRLKNALVYIQISRGVAPRDHAFPRGAVRGALVVTARPATPLTPARFETGLRVIAYPDLRWKRRDIKTVNLLPNCLAREAARAAGADDAWLIEGEHVTEATAANAWIVTRNGTVVTRPPAHEILNGITRLAVIALAKAGRIAFEERPFTLGEAQSAAEAFVSSTTKHVMPVVEIDGHTIGNGKPGPVTRDIMATYDTVAKNGGIL